jgi:DNA helicase HerA-like ATPase
MDVHIGNKETNFGLRPFHFDLDKAQFRHSWLLGKSGTGKSTLLRNILVEAIRGGCGIAVIDPHGDLVYDVFNYIPARRRTT